MRSMLLVLTLAMAAAPAAAQATGPQAQPHPDFQHATGGWEGWLWRHVRDHSPAARLEVAHQTEANLDREEFVKAARAIGKDRYTPVRAELWLALGVCGGGSSELFEGIAQDSERHAVEREAACVSLGLIGSARSILVLHAIAVDRRRAPGLRAAAIIGEGLLRDPSVVPQLLQVLGRPDDREVHLAATIALGLIGDRSAASRLAMILKSRRTAPPVRACAASALGTMAQLKAGRTDVVGLLRTLLLTDRDDDVRRSIALVFHRFLDADAGAHADSAAAAAKVKAKIRVQVIETLERAARNDADPLVRGYALCALAQAVRTDDITELRRVVDWLRQVARNEAHPLVRPFALLALGLVSSDRARTGGTLRTLFAQSTAVADRCAAAVALGLAGDTASRHLLARAATHAPGLHLRGYAAIGLSLLPYEPGTEEFLVQVATHVNVPEVQSAALRGLGLMGPSESGRAAIRRAFKQRNRYVKTAALTAVVDAHGIDDVTALISTYKRESNVQMRLLTVRAISSEVERHGARPLRRLFGATAWSSLFRHAPTLRYLSDY